RAPRLSPLLADEKCGWRDRHFRVAVSVAQGLGLWHHLLQQHWRRGLACGARDYRPLAFHVGINLLLLPSCRQARTKFFAKGTHNPSRLSPTWATLSMPKNTEWGLI